jgi:hypothetical protein
MSIVLPNEGEIELLNKMLQHTSDSENYILKLYNNNYTPDGNATTASFTTAIFSGYADVTLARSNWSNATLNASNKGQTSYSQQSWTCGVTGDTVYGYFVVGDISGKCLWAEKFVTPRTLSNTDILNITPSFTLSTDLNP